MRSRRARQLLVGAASSLLHESAWPRAGAHAAFGERRWDRRRQAAVERAFAEVPYYREQWASAGRALSEPVPVRAADLSEELFRLCPLRSPWDPRREPTLWIGDLTALADALTLAGARPRRLPVLEVRLAVVDSTRLGRVGAPYGVLLAPDADVAGDARRLALQLGSLKLALDHGRAVVVGAPTELPAVMRSAEAALGGVDVRWSLVPRLTLAEAAGADGGCEQRSGADGGREERFVVHDPYLGYVAARSPDCGEVHLLWNRIHARPSQDGLLFTRIRDRRPTLVNVIPVHGGFSTVSRCRAHGTPVLER
ncbi:MAG: hypothetical protein ABR521_08925 [Gaiellaceae bacterium]